MQKPKTNELSKCGRRVFTAAGLTMTGVALTRIVLALLLPWMAERSLGAESSADAQAPATLATFADIPGVTQAYVDAYNAYLQAKHADNPDGDYSGAIHAFTAIANDSPNPELRLRSS